MAGAMQLRKLGTRFRNDESAVSATEYAILLALIVLVCMATIQGIRSRVINLYGAIDGSLPEGMF